MIADSGQADHSSERSDAGVGACRSLLPSGTSRFERDREGQDRPRDTTDVFSRHIDLPRGPERERVRDRDRVYALRGSESRTLATVGAFRRAGQSLLERHRDSRPERHQTFHSGLVRSREREHDLQVYRAYEQAEGRLRERGAHVERVVLDHELKSEYQRWLHEHDKDRDDYDGHPDRTPEDIQEWAKEHDLPYFDEEVHFPDVRIEYVEPDGRWDREDIEVVTPHYRGAHGASVARAGFSTYGGMSLSIGGGGGGRGGRGGRSPSVVEELLR